MVTGPDPVTLLDSEPSYTHPPSTRPDSPPCARSHLPDARTLGWTQDSRVVSAESSDGPAPREVTLDPSLVGVHTPSTTGKVDRDGVPKSRDLP